MGPGLRVQGLGFRVCGLRFLKRMVTFWIIFGAPYNILGSTLGSPCFGKLFCR